MVSLNCCFFFHFYKSCGDELSVIIVGLVIPKKVKLHLDLGHRKRIGGLFLILVLFLVTTDPDFYLISTVGT